MSADFVKQHEDGTVDASLTLANHPPADPKWDRATIKKIIAGVIDWTPVQLLVTKADAAELVAELMAALTEAGLIDNE